MSASLTTSLDNAANPLDMMEEIVAANEWEFDRRSDSEMAAEAPGHWCDYGLFFNWSHEISVMHFTCAFDLKVPEKQRTALYELLTLANEKLWLGHFGLESDGRQKLCGPGDLIVLGATLAIGMACYLGRPAGVTYPVNPCLFAYLFP